MSSTKGSRSLTQSEVERPADQPRDRNADKDPKQMPILGADYTAGRAEQGVGGLDAALQSQIGHKLKIMFDQVANAAIPDKFLDLLDKLHSEEKLK